MGMSAKELTTERRRGRYTAAAAFTAAGLLMVGWLGALTVDRPPSGNRARLLHFDKHAGELLPIYILRSLGLLLLFIVAIHLYRATKARKPELNRVVGVMGILGPPVYAVATVGSGIALATISSDFADSASQTASAAHDAFRDPALITFGSLAFAGELALAFWFVAGSVSAMRAGLVTRFMAGLGVVLAPLLVFMPSLLVDPILSFWLAALGALFIGRWPAHTPPAWETGRAVPWPSTREPAVASGEVDASRNGEVEAVGPGVRTPEGAAAAAESGGARVRRRRKRKR
jgi:hypothetical protein